MENFKHHEAFEYFQLIGYPDTYGKVPGVYQIGDVYIGASKHIRRRLISHYNNLKKGWHTNKLLQRYFNYCKEHGEEIPVKILDFDPFKEAYWHQEIFGDRNGHLFFYHEQQGGG